MNGLNQQVRGSLRDGTPFPIKGSFSHSVVAIDADGDFDMIAAQRVVILEVNVMWVEVTTMGWVLVAFDNLFAVEVVHNFTLSFDFVALRSGPDNYPEISFTL